MQLTYRGARYTSQAQSVNASVNQEAGVFLGAHFQLRTAHATPVQRLTRQLKYRGVTYTA
ncbi:MAG: DUF4278 domain-containing protein [Cyanobacteria bacterium P01_A01_bin.114]